MKRIFKISSLLLAFLILLCSCSSSNDSAMRVGEGQVGSDVYAYYVDYVIANENKDKNMTEQQIKKRAGELCLEYIKINTKFSDMKLSLSASTKATIASDVTNRWSFFGGYYESIGVSKQTLTKIEENSAFRDMLLLAMYDKGGTNPIDEETIKSHFKDNYIFFKVISEYLKTTDDNGNEIAMSKTSVDAITSRFNDMAKGIDNDNTIDATNLAYATANGETASDVMPISVINKTSEAYPSGFFAQVSKISADSVEVLLLDDYIFLVQRIDNFNEAQNFYSSYRSICLNEIVAPAFSKTVSGWYADKKVVFDDRVQSSCYELVIDARSEG